MKNRSEGVRRIVMIFSILAAAGWILFVAIASNGFSRREMGFAGWAILIIGTPITFFVPQVISRAIYWVKDGFSQDKSS